MSEQAPITPKQPDAHELIAAKIEAAAASLPEHVVSIDEAAEGVTRINASSNTNGRAMKHGHVQLSKDGAGPDTAIGFSEIAHAAPETRTLGAYAFRSTEGEGVENVTVRRAIAPHETITRAGADHYRGEGQPLSSRARVYEHTFRPESKDKAAKLVTGMVVKQAARTNPRTKFRV